MAHSTTYPSSQYQVSKGEDTRGYYQPPAADAYGRNYREVHGNRGGHLPYRGETNSDNSTLLYSIMAVVLVAITAVAAYYCLKNGFNLQDTAFTSWEEFQSGVLIYMGVAFSFAAVGNAVYGGYKVAKSVYDEEKMEYSKQEMVLQVAASILAPLALLPVGIGCCAMGALGGR